MSRRVSMGLLAMSAGVFACGGDSSPGKTTDAGIVDDTPNPAYWGLKDKNCFRYDDGSGQNAFTIAVVEDKNTIADTLTYRLQFRHNGFQQREEWVEVKADGLVLWRRTEPGDAISDPPKPITYYLFSSPAPVYLAKDTREQQEVMTQSTARVSGGAAAETVAYTFRVINYATEPVTVEDSEYSSTNFIVTATRDDDGSGTADKIWFVPDLGIAKYELSGSNVAVTLAKVDTNVPTQDCTP